MSSTNSPIKTFICYADEDRSTVEAMLKHLRQLAKKGLLEIWDDGQIQAGQDWDKAIKIRLETAQLILLFVSVDFMDSEYIEKTELKAALQRHRDGLSTLVPIIVRSCDWADYFEMGKFQALPKQAKPILSAHFPILDDAYYEVTQGIKALAQDLHQKMEAVREAEALAERQKEADEKQAATQATRIERLRKNDETAWETASEAVKKAQTEREKIIALETYLDEPDHKIHRDAAENQIQKLKKAETQRKIEEKQRDEEQRKKREAEEAAETARKKREAEEAERKKGLPEMVVVEGGTFKMGDEHGDLWSACLPVHTVSVQRFEIGKYLVTQKLWREVMGSDPPELYFEGNDQCPVESVSWNDVQDFFKKINQKFPGRNFRLPSEAEWEFAARGGNASNKTKYAGSNDLKEVGWFTENSNEKTHPVGEKKANELGIHDMSGNVWEWCEDDWLDNYNSAPSDGKAWVDAGRSVNRVYRGGSWGRNPVYCRVAYRDGDTPTNRTYGIGFRLARSF